MIRRDFFKALAAASAAIFASRWAVASLPKPKPAKAPTLESDPQAFIRELLKKAAVVSFSRVATAGDLVVMDVEYVYDEKGRYAVNLNEELKQHLPDTAVMQACEVVCQLKEDLAGYVHHLGDRKYAPPVEPEQRIIIRWLCA